MVFVDPNDLDLPGDGNDDGARDPEFTKITEEAEAFIFVVPEYNHGYSGSLKRVIDSEYDNHMHKPLAVAGVSSGRFAGVRAIASLAEVVRQMGMVMTTGDILVGDSYNAYNEETGEPKDDYIEESISASLTELKWMAETLKYGRENLPSKHD